MAWIPKRLDKYLQTRRNKKAHEIASSMYEFSSDFGIENPDDLIARKGVKIYRDMMQNDPEIEGAIQELVMSVLGVPWSIKPGVKDNDKATEIAGFVEKNIKNIGGGRRVAQNVLSWLYECVSLPLVQGNMVSEINWRQDDGKLWIDNIKSKVPEDYEYATDDAGNLKHIRFLVSGQWRDMQPEDLFTVQWLPHYANWHGNSHLRAVYGYYFLSKVCVKQAAIFAQKRSGGMWVGKYKTDNKKMKTALAAALQNAASSNYIIYPDGAEIEAVSNTSGSEGQFWSQMDEWSKRKIRRSILGLTTTAEASREGDAAGQESRDTSVKEPLVQFVSDNLCIYIQQQLIEPLVNYNFGSQEDYPEFGFQNRKAKNKREAIEVATMAFNQGVKIPLSFYTDECGIPEPEDGEEFIHISQVAAIRSQIELIKGTGGRGETIPSQLPDSVGNLVSTQFSESAKAKKIRLDHRKLKRDLDALEQTHRLLIVETVQRIEESLLNTLNKNYDNWAKNRKEINSINILLLGRLEGQFRRLGKESYRYGAQTSKNQIAEARAFLKLHGFAEEIPAGPAYTVPDDVADAVSDHWSAKFSVNMRSAATQAFWDGFQAGESRQQIADRFKTEWKKFGGKGEPDTWYALNRQIRNASMDCMNMARYDAGQRSQEIQGYIYNAILDSRTTELCRGLHGSQFPKGDPRISIYKPPNHHQCRSYYDYVFSWELPTWNEFPAELPAKGFGS